jgi:hypothetical protein
MRKVALGLVALVGLSMGACCATFDKAAVTQLRNNDDLVMPEYLKYVDADVASGKMTKAQGDDRHKLVDSRKGLLDSIDKAGK